MFPPPKGIRTIHCKANESRLYQKTMQLLVLEEYSKYANGPLLVRPVQ